MKYNVWACKVVVPEGELPNAFDGIPREAVIKAIEGAGIEVITCFSGWGGGLSKGEDHVYWLQYLLCWPSSRRGGQI